MRRKIFKIILIVLAAVFAVCLFLYFSAGPKSRRADYGVTFSYPYAQSLGLDWKQAYREMLEDLKVKKIRVPAYWNTVEPREGEYYFDDLDFQVSQAEAHNAKIILALGQRLPRWPECHEPEWAKSLSPDAHTNALLSLVETVVRKYEGSPAVEIWQVENEPFLGSFGQCPKLDVAVLDREIALVKKLDPSRPVLISDSGELSLWIKSGKRGDIFGTTLYRYVFSDIFKRYWVNYIPSWFYRIKGGLLRLLNHGKQIVIIELQTEPWTTKGIVKTSIDEQFRTMSMKKFNTMLEVAGGTGYSPQYLWGVEWWYWMKQHDHPEFWDRTKELMQTR